MTDRRRRDRALARALDRELAGELSSLTVANFKAVLGRGASPWVEKYRDGLSSEANRLSRQNS